MEAITQLVAESLARHGFDRPVDPRRLQWSRWFRCDSPHSLLVVPSKPGIFALAEEIMDLGAATAHVGTDAFVRPTEQSSVVASSGTTLAGSTVREGHDFSRAVAPAKNPPASAAAGIIDGAHPANVVRRMLGVLQFSEDDDMAFTLDRMFTRINPMRARLASGKCFLRFVVIEDQAQRRTICAALNQWMLNTAEKATGLGADFQSSLELNVARAPSPLPPSADATTNRVGTDAFVRPAATTDRMGRTLLSDSAESTATSAPALPLKPGAISAVLNTGAAKNLHCPQPLPSGF